MPNELVPRRVLRTYIDTYLDAVAAVEGFDLVNEQAPPYTSLGEGAAGTAYALWRLGERRRAASWIAAALADHRRAAFHATLSPTARRTSIVFGRAGVGWVSALVNGADHLDVFTRALNVRYARLEYASGPAGQLLAALILLRRQPHALLEAGVTRLAQRLERATDRRARRPWKTT